MDAEGNLVLASPLSKGRVSKLGSLAVSLVATPGIDASAGEKVLKTLISVNYQRICVFKNRYSGITFSEHERLSSSFGTI